VIVFYLLIWILPLVEHDIWGMQVGPFTVFQYIGLLCLGLAVLRVFTKGQIPHIFSTWPTRLYFALFLIAMVSSIIDALPGQTFPSNPFQIYLSSTFIFILSVALVDTLQRLRWAILALIGSYAWASLYVIKEWRAGVAYDSGYRPGYIVGDANYFSTAAIYSIALAFYFMQGKRPRWMKIYCAGSLLVILLGVMVCASRGGFLGLCAAAVILIWRSQHRVRNFVMLVVLLVPPLVLLPSSPLQRFLHPTFTEKGSETAHQEAWKAGGRMVMAHPFMGIGLGSFKPLEPQYADPGLPEYNMAHNMFVEVAAELGIPALLIFISVFLSSFFLLGKIRKTENIPRLVYDASTAFQAGLFGVMVAGCFVSAEYQKTTWMGMALIPCLLPLSRLKEEDSELAPETNPSDSKNEAMLRTL
jgi:O-antigen ligase